MSTVIVSEKSNPVHLPVADGTTQLVGEVISRIFEGEKTQRHLFKPTGSDNEPPCLGIIS